MTDLNQADDGKPEGADEPGDAQGVPVPHDEPLEGSSEAFPAVEGMRVIHPPADDDEANGDTGGRQDRRD